MTTINVDKATCEFVVDNFIWYPKILCLQMSLEGFPNLDEMLNLDFDIDEGWLQELCDGGQVSKKTNDVGKDVTATNEPTVEKQINGLACPVPTCKTDTFSRPAALRRHWQHYHLRSVVMWNCSAKNCRYRSPRDDRVREHMSKVHKDLEKTTALPCTMVLNNKYRDTKGVLPPSCIGPVQEPTLPIQPKIQPPKRKSNDKSQEVPQKYHKKEDNLDLIMPIPKITSISPERSVEELTRAEILKEFNKNEHILIVVGKRQRFLKKALKKREVEEDRKLKEDLSKKDEEIKQLQDSIRKKDREIRHLKAEWRESPTHY